MNDARRTRNGFGARVGLVACTLALVLAACQRPRFEGPQLQDPPEGFTYKDGAGSAHITFPDREIVRSGAWTRGTGEPFSAITITWYRGAATPEEVLEARDAQERRYQPDGYQFGELELTEIDGRDAWGWLVTHQDARGLHSRAYRVAVPYDSMTYTIEFFSNKTSLKTNPDSLRWGVASFGIGVTTWNRQAVVLGALAGVVVLFLGYKKLTADPFAANRNVRLVEIPVPDDADRAGGAAGERAAGPAAPGAGGPTGPGPGGPEPPGATRPPSPDDPAGRP